MSSLSLLVSFPDEPGSLEILASQLGWDSQAVSVAQRLYAKRLPPLADTSALPYIFGVSPKLFSAMGRAPARYYRRFSRAKRGGGSRDIEAPRRFLKVIQRWINEHVLSSVELPPCVLGFVRGSNIFDNGKLHTDGKNLMVVDIRDFFPSVQRKEIDGLFNDLGFPPPVAKQLGSLCSYDERLPQGAPTSPAIANGVFRAADAKLAKLATSWDCEYSRYADDLAFSGPKNFTKADVKRVETVVKRYGFAINPSKTRRIGPGGCQIVTGLVVNITAQPPRWKRRLWRAMFDRASKHPREFFEREPRLRGIAAFVNQYDSTLASEYRAVADMVAGQSGPDNGLT